MRYPFRVSSGQSADGNGTRVHLNIDPGARALSADLDGVLTFEARAPRFDGAVTLAVPRGPQGQRRRRADHAVADHRPRSRPIRPPRGSSSSRPATAPRSSALKFAGAGDIRFGASPLLHAVLSARQLDADKFVAKDDARTGAAEPMRLLPGLRALMAAIPQPPIPAQIEFSSEQIMLGGRPLQNLAADLHGDAKSWTIDRLDFRAPGATRVAFSGANAQPVRPTASRARSASNSSDPDTLVAWLQGRSEIAYRSQKPLRLRGDVSVAAGSRRHRRA